MMLVKRLEPADPFEPRYAAVGKESGVVIMRFENRINAVEFVDWNNSNDGK